MSRPSLQYKSPGGHIYGRKRWNFPQSPARPVNQSGYDADQSIDPDESFEFSREVSFADGSNRSIQVRVDMVPEGTPNSSYDAESDQGSYLSSPGSASPFNSTQGSGQMSYNTTPRSANRSYNSTPGSGGSGPTYRRFSSPGSPGSPRSPRSPGSPVQHSTPVRRPRRLWFGAPPVVDLSPENETNQSSKYYTPNASLNESSLNQSSLQMSPQAVNNIMDVMDRFINSPLPLPEWAGRAEENARRGPNVRAVPTSPRAGPRTPPRFRTIPHRGSARPRPARTGREPQSPDVDVEYDYC